MVYRYLARRVIYAAISFFGVATIAFVLFRIVPGDPVALMIVPGVTAEDIRRLRESLGLAEPPHIQFGSWMAGVVTLNFGESFWFRLPARQLIFERLPATIELVVAAFALAIVVGVAVSILSIMHRGRHLDRMLTSSSFFGFAIPDFLWAVMFVVIFGGILRVLPISGRLDPSFVLLPYTNFMTVDALLAGNLPALGSALQHLVLPAVALALGLITVVFRTLRGSLLDVLQEDYILTDRMKGLSERYILLVRALKNAALPMLTIIGVQLNFLIGGTVLLELIFGWPGLGQLAITAVNRRDLPVVQGIIVVYALIVIATNILVDFLYTRLNPRIRFR